jgi:hypothetical protein
MRLLSCTLFVCATAAAVVAADEFKPEPGFKLIFNGKNFDGWQTKGAKPMSLEGKTDAYDGRYVIKDGEIVIDYKMKADRYIETVQQFSGDFTIRYDFKPGEGCNNDTLLIGTKFDILAGGKLKGVKDNEWNTMEIVAKGGSVDFIVNGQKLATQKTKGEKGPLILRAEFGQITYKNIRATERK